MLLDGRCQRKVNIFQVYQPDLVGVLACERDGVDPPDSKMTSVEAPAHARALEHLLHV